MTVEAVVWGVPGCGKCVVPETYVFTTSGMVPIGSLSAEFPCEDGVLPLTGVGVQSRDGVSSAELFYNGGQKQTFRLRTRAGFELTGTLVHPVLALRDGCPSWTSMSELKVGMRVGVRFGGGTFALEDCPLPEQRNERKWRHGVEKKITTPSKMTVEFAEWLGWFIGEGCWGKSSNSIAFCNHSEPVIDRVRKLTIQLFGVDFLPGGFFDFHIVSIRLKRWLAGLGIAGLSAEKKVPQAVLRSTEAAQRAFLRALFEADGSIYASQETVEYSTASEEMARQVQLMLLNFGITARRTWKEIETPRWGVRKYWRVSFHGNQIDVFRRRLGFMEESKKQGLLNQTEVQRGHQWDLHGIPVEFVRPRYKAIREHMRNERIVRDSLQGHRKDSVQALVSKGAVATCIESFSDLSGVEPYDELKREFENPTYWDEVEEISDAGIRQVIDLVVPEGHSFVGNGIICHNTEWGTSLARDLIYGGLDSSRVAYLAFTKAAAKAAATRILDSEDDSRLKEQFPFFRTIHSLGYMGLRKNKPDLKLMKTGDMKHFARTESMDGVYAVYDWEDLAEVYRKMEDQGRTEWDQALSMYNLSRVTARGADDLMKARTQPSSFACKLGYMELGVYQAFVQKYEKFKAKEGLIDFTDMLEYAMTEMPPIDCEYVILDEAQDLSASHHKIIDKVFPNARQIFWIGDDDQAIYGWSGASAELFLERAKRARYQVSLLQTHRFGQSIVDFSKKIIQRVANRHDKETIGFEGKDGKITLSGEFKPVFGDYLILHRHVAGCQAIARDYIEAGVPFRCERGGSNPLRSNGCLSSWKTFDILAKGGRVQLNHAAEMIDELMPGSVVSGHKEKVLLLARGARTYLKQASLPREEVGIKDLIDLKILTYQGADTITQRQYGTLKHGDDLEYFERTERNGYSLEAEKVPRIVTIHGAKGRQAERVVVFTEMGKKCWDDPDAENRLAYVAATRTQSDVTICAESKVEWAASEYDYPLEVTSELQ